MDDLMIMGREKRRSKIYNFVVSNRTNGRRYIHISPYLHRLHWLPIQFRIIFKVLLLTHNSLHHKRPEYISSLISFPTHTISLRSTTSYLLHLHTTNIRAWHISAPYLWNKRLHNLRSTQSTTSFKSLLKTYLFTIAFP